MASRFLAWFALRLRAGHSRRNLGRRAMSNKMWGGRFPHQPDAVMEDINASVDFDRHLFRRTLREPSPRRDARKQGIITADDAADRSRSRHESCQRSKAASSSSSGRSRTSHERGKPARRADRARGGAAAHRALAQRPGREPISDCGSGPRSTTVDAARRLPARARGEGARTRGR